MGNMREISVQECKAVFGGTDEPDEIVVTAPKKYQASVSFYDSTWAFGSAGGFGLADIADMFNSLGLEMIEGNYPVTPDDTNGNGVPDWEEGPGIVVTAEFTGAQLQSINQQAAWAQWEMNMILNALIAERLLVSGLSNIAVTATGVAIGGATSLPPVDDAQYQAMWELVYQGNVSAKYGYIPENGPIYVP